MLVESKSLLSFLDDRLFTFLKIGWKLILKRKWCAWMSCWGTQTERETALLCQCPSVSLHALYIRIYTEYWLWDLYCELISNWKWAVFLIRFQLIWACYAITRECRSAPFFFSISRLKAMEQRLSMEQGKRKDRKAYSPWRFIWLD